jgi:hypothetical protein
MNRALGCFLTLTLLWSSLWSQSLGPTASTEAATPEMIGLAKAFVGDWNTTEAMERSEYFPNGADVTVFLVGGLRLVEQ